MFDALTASSQCSIEIRAWYENRSATAATNNTPIASFSARSIGGRAARGDQLFDASESEPGDWTVARRRMSRLRRLMDLVVDSRCGLRRSAQSLRGLKKNKRTKNPSLCPPPFAAN